MKPFSLRSISLIAASIGLSLSSCDIFNANNSTLSDQPETNSTGNADFSSAQDVDHSHQSSNISLGSNEENTSLSSTVESNADFESSILETGSSNSTDNPSSSYIDSTSSISDFDPLESSVDQSTTEIESDSGLDSDSHSSITNQEDSQSTDTANLPEVEFLEMPVFFINTEDASPIVSKEEYVNGELYIRNSDGYDADALSLGIRGRGNYSWSGTDKKSYRIKFDTKYQPLGQGKGKAKSWTLLAVHCDKSLLRTDAAFHFASKLDNLPFVSSSSFVELYLNGSYDGVYELCDQIQVNKARVNIDDTGEEDDIGYLVELDKNASEDVIRISSYETYEVKSDYVSQSQLDYISDYMSQCYEAIVSGDQTEVGELIDLPSAVDAYLVEEIFKNLDVGWGSFYYTKPKGDKLYFGPVWDFDLSAGNADADDYDPDFPSYEYTYVGNDYFSYMQQHLWYTYLRECDWFNQMVAERFAEVVDDALETVDYIHEKAAELNGSFNRNFTRWNIWRKKINREPSAIMNIRSFDGQVNYLADWLSNRIEWLSNYYAGQVEDITWDYGW